MKDKPMLETIDILKEFDRDSLHNNPNYFIEKIENNDIESFFANLEDEDERKEILEMDFNTFKFQLNILYETAELYENSYKEEIEFLSKYIDKLFNSIKDGNKDLKSIFLSDEDKNRFYELLKEYFTGGFIWKKIKIEEADPNFKEISKPDEIQKAEYLTQEEINELIK